MNYETDRQDKPIDSRNPKMVRDVGVAHEKEAISAESVTFVTGAASLTGKVGLNKGPIASLRGNRVGSFWRDDQNVLLSNRGRSSSVSAITSVTEADGSAAVVITDTDFDLTNLFHTPAATSPYVILIRDADGSELYGFVGAVVKSSDSYTLSVYSEPALSSQNWVGSQANYSFPTGGGQFVIYENSSSFSWVTGTVLTREVLLDITSKTGREQGIVELLDSMTAGDFAIDYETATVYYKKATTGTTDTCNYSVLKAYQTATISGTVTVDSEFPAAAVAADNFANPTTTNSMSMGMVYDGSAWDRQKGDSTNGTLVSGNVAHDAADSGNPVKIGGKAASTKPTAVSAADRVDAYFDLFGRQHVYDEGGGGVSGGGLSTYVFTPSNSFGHGTSAYGSGTTFTVSGHSFTPEAVALTKVDRFNSSGVFQETLSPSQGTITAATTAGVTTYTYAAGSFSAGDLFVVYQAGPERTVSVPTDSARSTVVNPTNSHRSSDVIAYINITTNTTTNNYFDIEGRRFVGLGLDTSGTTPTDTLTITIEISFQNDGTAAASCRYYDYTLDLTGAASWVDTDFSVIIDVPVAAKYLKVKSVTSNGGGNDADLTIDYMATY